MQKKGQVLIASMIGNALEFYDFMLYGVFATVFAKLFFPSSDPFISVLSSWAAFAAGFLMRPIGAIAFGYIGDKFGRKRALTISILLTSFPILMIGLMPSYEQIGLWAPCLVIFARLLQGLCTGGEYNGAAIFALEHLSKKNGRTFPGMAGGLITASCSIGAILATAMGAIVTYAGVDNLWRVPFLLGALISLIGFYIRNKLTESPEFEKAVASNLTNLSLFKILKNHPKSCFTAFSIGGLNGVMSYLLFAFLNIYLSKYLQIELTHAMLFSMCGLFSFMILSPLFGYISDHFNSRAYFFTASVTILIISSIVFWLLQTRSFSAIIVAEIMLGGMLASIGGPQHAFMQNLFPVQDRYTGISFNFCLGMALFGGTTPMVLTYLIERTGNLNMPIILLSTCSTLFIIALIILGPLKIRSNISDQPSSL